MDFMFSTLFSTMKGAVPVGDNDGRDKRDRAAVDSSDDEASSSTLKLWAVLSALGTQMADSVKKQAAEVATSVNQTDWGSELVVFGKAVQNETVELGNKTAKALEAFPDQADTVLPALSTVVGPDVPQQLQGVSRTLAGIGKDIFEGTREVGEFLKQAYDTVEAELDAAMRSRRSSSSPHTELRTDGAAKCSWLEAEVSAMERDSDTYCEEPPNQEDFRNWLETFSLAARKPQVDQILKENAFMAELHSHIVPRFVEYDVFWTRYFYRLHKLQEKCEQQQFAPQTTRLHEEEEATSWGDDYQSDSDYCNDHDGSMTDPDSIVELSVPSTDDMDACSGSGRVQRGTMMAACRPCDEKGVGGPKGLGETSPGESLAGPFAVEDLPISTTADSLTGAARSCNSVSGIAETTNDTESGPEAETASDSSSGLGWCVVKSAKDRHWERRQSRFGQTGTKEGAPGVANLTLRCERAEEDWGAWE